MSLPFLFIFHSFSSVVYLVSCSKGYNRKKNGCSSVETFCYLSLDPVMFYLESKDY